MVGWQTRSAACLLARRINPRVRLNQEKIELFCRSLNELAAYLNRCSKIAIGKKLYLETNHSYWSSEQKNIIIDDKGYYKNVIGLGYGRQPPPTKRSQSLTAMHSSTGLL